MCGKLDFNQPLENKSRGGRNYIKTGIGYGGRREGSGRRVSPSTQKTRQIIEQLYANGGITPLGYLLSLLRETPYSIRKQYESGEIDIVQYRVNMEGLTERRDWAAVTAAPYVHPRISATTASPDWTEHDDWVKTLIIKNQDSATD